MGIFDGIKRNLNIGGLKVQNFSGPTVFSFEDAAAALSFTLVTKESAAHVNSMQLSLIQERYHPNDTKSPPRFNTVRHLELTNGGSGWDVPAETQLPFNLELPLDMGETMEQAGGVFAAKAAELIGQLGAVQGFLHPDARWYFDLKVDVADVMLDPGARIEAQLQSFGQFKAATRFTL